MSDAIQLCAAQQHVEPVLVSRFLSDVDEQAGSLSGWHQEYQQLGCGSYAGSVHSIALPRVELIVESSNRQLHQRGTIPEHSVMLAFALDASAEGWLSGKKFDQQTMIVLTEDYELDFRTPPDLTVAGLVFDEHLLRQYLPACNDSNPLNNAIHHCFAAIEPTVLENLRRHISTIASELQLGLLNLSQPASQKAFCDALIGNFMHALGAVNHIDQALPRSALLRLKTVNKAIEYMRAHIDETISIIDVCSALYVEQRVLNYCFQEVIGLLPILYLKYLRLNQVRRQLLRASSAPCNIGNIAASSGFWHPSRFSTEYRKLFGELPSETVRRSDFLS